MPGDEGRETPRGEWAQGGEAHRIHQLTLAHDAGLGRDRGVAALKSREE